MPDSKPFFLREQQQLDDLDKWLERREYTWFKEMKDSKQNPMVGLKASVPDSDRMTNAGLIIVINHELKDAALFRVNAHVTTGHQ